MIFSVATKIISGISQILVIYYVSKIFNLELTSLILVLIGYITWFQLFEFGLTQSIQNGINCKKLKFKEIPPIIAIHLIITSLVALLIIALDIDVSIFFSGDLKPEELKIGAFGISLLIINSNNAIIQRFLLLINKNKLANIIIIIQAFLVPLILYGLYIFQVENPYLVISLIFLSQGLININIIKNFAIRSIKIGIKKIYVSCVKIYKYSLQYFTVSVLPIVSFGSDYYFISKYLDPANIILYHLLSRIYFFSFAGYYSYLLHRTKRINLKVKSNNKLIYKEVFAIGFILIIIVFLSTLILKYYSNFNIIINDVDLNTLIFAFFYYIIRINNDIRLFINILHGNIFLIVLIYLILLFINIVVIEYLISKYLINGVYLSLLISNIVVLIILRKYDKSLINI